MKNKVVAGILAIFLGCYGVHHFYLGDTNKGVIYLAITLIGVFTCWFLCFTCVLPSIVAIIGLVEGVMILTMDDEKFNQKYNTPKTF
jgi:TM2 domain-containing membrane protein YozV